MANAIKSAVLTLAAAGLAVAPVAAQAKTRASDSGPVYTASSAKPGEGRTAKGESIVSGSSFFIGILVGLWTSGIIVVAADLDDDDNQSPGAN